MLQINVSQQRKSPIGTVKNYQVNDVIEISNGINPVQGNITLIRTDRSILIEGTLYTEVELTCSRCLNTFISKLTLNIEEEYYPTSDIITGVPLSLPDEPGYFTIDEHNIIDLTEALRQYILMAIPIKPLCQQDCAGLCPTCGVNLNQSECNCPQITVDPRLAKLTELLSNQKQVLQPDRKD